MNDDDTPDVDEEVAVEYDLVLPFVVCQSQGGPLDDHAFVCGATFGMIRAELVQVNRRLIGWRAAWYVHPDLVPLLDLLAMEQELALTIEPWDEHPDEWVLATFQHGKTEPS